jgi:ribosomal protein S18 acetylase RimI-like enzyme
MRQASHGTLTRGALSGPAQVAAMRPSEGGAVWGLMREAMLAEPSLAFPGRRWYARLCRAYAVAVRSARLAGVGTRIYVLKLGSRIAGSLLVTDFTSLGFAGEFRYIGHVVVAPTERGHGYGGRLVEDAVVAERAAGGRRAILDVDTANAPAVRLYRHAGFLETLRGYEVTGPLRRSGETPLYWAGLSMPLLARLAEEDFPEFRGLRLRRLRWAGEFGLRWIGLLGRSSVLLRDNVPVALITDRSTNHRGLRAARILSACPSELYPSVLEHVATVGLGSTESRPRLVVTIGASEAPRLRAAIDRAGLRAGLETMRMISD